MTLDEAIKILSELREMNLIDKSKDRKGAILLGMEALKFVKMYRPVCCEVHTGLLLGETEE